MQVLLAGVDEISDYNFNIERLGGWYKDSLPDDLYSSRTTGSLAGEGVAAYLLSNNATNAVAKITALQTLTTHDSHEVMQWVRDFISENIADRDAIVFLSGHNGDVRFAEDTEKIEALLSDVTLARFKHFTGEYPTASAVALWLATQFVQKDADIPEHFTTSLRQYRHRQCLIYNHYKFLQHSLMLVEQV